MLKIPVFCLSLICAFLLLGSRVGAQRYDYGAESIYEALPDETREYLDKKDITPENGGALELSPKEIFSDLLETLAESAEKPLRMFASVLAVIMLTSLLSGIKGSIDQPKTDYIFSLVSSLAGTIVLVSFLSGTFEGISKALSGASDLMLAYVPVLAGVIAAGGGTASASVFTAVMMTVIEALTQIISKLLIPLSGIMLGVSAAGGLDPDIKLEKISEGIKKMIVWSLGLIMTVFIGILTVQSSIASAADSVALRAAKFAVSSGVPFVGGAVSDALAVVKSSLIMLKTGMGSFCVIAVCAALLPTMITALCFRFFLFVCGVISEIFSADALGKVIRCGENVMSILIAAIVCVFLFATVSTTLLILFTKQ